jgi:hypothetical protein
MYNLRSFKFLTDFFLPYALLVFYQYFGDMRLYDYDSYQNEKVGELDLQNMIDDGDYSLINKIFHNLKIELKKVEGIPEDQKVKYVVFVYSCYFIIILLFIKFKNQLRMNYYMNSVIHLVETSLKDASFFFVYYLLLNCFFCSLYIVLGSVVPTDDYNGLTDSSGKPVRYQYYLIQSFRNSIGDLEPPLYQFWDDYGSNGKLVIFSIWCNWIASFLFLSLLSLNFLIAVF